MARLRRTRTAGLPPWVREVVWQGDRYQLLSGPGADEVIDLELRVRLAPIDLLIELHILRNHRAGWRSVIAHTRDGCLLTANMADELRASSFLLRRFLAFRQDAFRGTPVYARDIGRKGLVVDLSCDSDWFYLDEPLLPARPEEERVRRLRL